MRRAGTIITAEKHVLLVKGPTGRLSFPKGVIEEGESALDAARRETREETGFDVSKEQLVAVHRDDFRYIYFHVRLTKMITPCVPPSSASEIKACIWHPMSRTKGRFNYDVYRYLTTLNAARF